MCQAMWDKHDKHGGRENGYNTFLQESLDSSRRCTHERRIQKKKMCKLCSVLEIKRVGVKERGLKAEPGVNNGQGQEDPL